MLTVCVVDAPSKVSDRADLWLAYKRSLAAGTGATSGNETIPQFQIGRAVRRLVTQA